MDSVTANVTDQDLLDRVERAYAERAAAQRAEEEAVAAAADAEAEAADREHRKQAMKEVDAAIEDAVKTGAALVKCGAEWRRLAAKLNETPAVIRRVLLPFGGAPELMHESGILTTDELDWVLEGRSLSAMPGVDVTVDDCVDVRCSRLRKIADRFIQAEEE